jgi:tetratricopeptide (TPR) repeat protein
VVTMLQLGSVAIAEGKNAEAKQLAADAVDMAKRNNMTSLAIFGLIDVGNAFHTYENLTEARKYYEQALTEAVAYNDARLEARARISLGSLEIFRGDVDEGLVNVNKALEFYKSGGYRNEWGTALLLIGRAKRDKGEYNEALRALNERLQLAQQAGIPNGIADANNEIGKVFLAQEKPDEALTHFQVSYSIYQNAKDQRSLGNNLVNRGEALWRLGEYDQANAVLDQAFNIAGQSEGFKTLLIAVYQARAEMMLSKGLFSDAKSSMEEAFRRIDAEDSSGQIQARRLFGLVATRGGDKRKGTQWCTEAYEKAQHQGIQRLLSDTQLALAEALLENGDAQKSHELALQAEENFARAEQSESLWRAWSIAALARKQLGDQARAREEAAKADATFSDLDQKSRAAGFANYSARPDVHALREKLSKVMSSSK